MRRRGFSLFELVIVCVILGILLAMGYGLLAKYRARTMLNAATDRMVSELANAKSQSQAFGLNQLRNGAPLPSPLPPSGVQAPGTNPLFARIVEKIPATGGGNGYKITKQWELGEPGRRVDVRFANLPALGLNATVATDQGLNLEIVQQPNTVLASVAFEPDGHPNLINATAAAIYMSLGPNSSDPEFEISISPIGTFAKQKIR